LPPGPPREALVRGPTSQWSVVGGQTTYQSLVRLDVIPPYQVKTKYAIQASAVPTCKKVAKSLIKYRANLPKYLSRGLAALYAVMRLKWLRIDETVKRVYCANITK